MDEILVGTVNETLRYHVTVRNVSRVVKTIYFTTSNKFEINNNEVK